MQGEGDLLGTVARPLHGTPPSSSDGLSLKTHLSTGPVFGDGANSLDVDENGGLHVVVYEEFPVRGGLFPGDEVRGAVLRYEMPRK
jgi:hypothetical protein